MLQNPGCAKRGRSNRVGSYRPFFFIGLLFLTLGWAAGVRADDWEAPAWADTLKNPIQRDSVAQAEAAALYQKNCSVCHGETGKGDGMMAKSMQPPAANFTEAAGINEDSDGALFWKISTGKKPMPTWKKDLTEAQIWLLVNYIRKFQPPATPPDSLKKAQPDTTKP